MKRLKIALVCALCALSLSLSACGKGEDAAKEADNASKTTVSNTEAQKTADNEEVPDNDEDEASETEETAKSEEVDGDKTAESEETSQTDGGTINVRDASYVHHNEETDWDDYILVTYRDDGMVQIAFGEQNTYAMFPDSSISGFVDVVSFSFEEGSDMGTPSICSQVSMKIEGDTAVLQFSNDGVVGEPVVYTKVS